MTSTSSGVWNIVTLFIGPGISHPTCQVQVGLLSLWLCAHTQAHTHGHARTHRHTDTFMHNTHTHAPKHQLSSTPSSWFTLSPMYLGLLLRLSLHRLSTPAIQVRLRPPVVRPWVSSGEAETIERHIPHTPGCSQPAERDRCQTTHPSNTMWNALDMQKRGSPAGLTEQAKEASWRRYTGLSFVG